MYKHQTILVTLIIFGNFLLHAQNPWEKLSLVNTIEIQAQLISTDKLGNLYAATNQEIFKYDSNGKLLQKNSIKSFGDLSTLDVSNPMKILAFYKDYNKVVFIDNMLASSGSNIDLSAVGFDQATLVCSSHDNGIWVYNTLNFELVRMDPSLKITHQSGNIAQLTGNAIKPSALFETNNKVYLCDTTFGVLIFDVFGTFIKTIPMKAIIELQVENNILYYTDSKGFNSFNMDLLQKTEIALPENKIKQIRLQKNRVYIRLVDKISVYTYD